MVADGAIPPHRRAGKAALNARVPSPPEGGWGPIRRVGLGASWAVIIDVCLHSGALHRTFRCRARRAARAGSSGTMAAKYPNESPPAGPPHPGIDPLVR